MNISSKRHVENQSKRLDGQITVIIWLRGGTFGNINSEETENGKSSRKSRKEQQKEHLRH